MPLIDQQRIVYVAIRTEDYQNFDAKVRGALEVFPSCRVVAFNTHTFLWGSHTFVTIETV